MRRALVLGLILVVVPGTAGAQQVTIQQLEQVLAASGAVPAVDADEMGKTDLIDQINREDALAPRLTALELTERLTDSSRKRLAAKYSLGPLTRSALELLGDRSALLDPPTSEFPDLPPPGAEAQKLMVRQARDFVFQTLTHLPDFFALLSTTQFDDGPVMAGGEMLYAGPRMHLVGSSEREITFSEGKEVFDSSRMSRATTKREEGLASQGEFGTEAATVFLDLAHGTLAFHHWENSALGPVSVFRYAVPQASSHYEVKYSCHGQASFHALPAYHGTLSIDPASGVLVRFTVQAESSVGDPITRVGSAIDYGSVVLGAHRYFCPVRSLAVTVEEADTCSEPHRRQLKRPVTMLNRVIFSDYHRLGSDMVIVPGTQEPGKPAGGTETGQPDAPALPRIVPPSEQVLPSNLIPPSV